MNECEKRQSRKTERKPGENGKREIQQTRENRKTGNFKYVKTGQKQKKRKTALFDRKNAGN